MKTSSSTPVYPSLFSALKGLCEAIIDRHNGNKENNALFLSQALEEDASISSIREWFHRTATKIKEVTENIEKKKVFAHVDPGSLEKTVETIRKTGSIYTLSVKPSPSEMLGNFLFWSCLDEDCHDSIVDSFGSMQKGTWALNQREDSNSSDEKNSWKWLLSCAHSIQRSIHYVFKTINPGGKGVNFIHAVTVRILVGRDIIPRSVRFYEQIGLDCQIDENIKIGLSCKIDENTKVSESTRNVSETVLRGFLTHLKTQPELSQDSLDLLKDLHSGRKIDLNTNSIHTGVDIGTFAKTIGFTDKLFSKSSKTSSIPTAPEFRRKHMVIANQVPNSTQLSKLILRLTAGIPNDFRLCGNTKDELLHREKTVVDRDGLAVLTACLMIIKHHSDSFGRKLLLGILPTHLEGRNLDADGSIQSLLEDLRVGTGLMKSEFVTALLDNELGPFSKNSDIWKIHFQDECRQKKMMEEGIINDADEDVEKGTMAGEEGKRATTRAPVKKRRKEALV